MKNKYHCLLFILLIFLVSFFSHAQNNITVWETDPLNKIFFEQKNNLYFSDQQQNIDHSITIDASKTYQSIDGFGFTLTGGSAMHLMKMSVAARSSLLHELFGTDKNHIGTSYLRISIGASDLDEKVFSYDDLPDGETDTSLQYFDLGYDKKYLIPVLKEILKINHSIKILGSPWSPLRG